jgi:hypothetical protein
MNWLAILLAFQIGTSDNQVKIYRESVSICSWGSPEDAFYIDMEMGIELFKSIEISSFMKSYQIKNTMNNFFSPYEIDYGFSTNIKYNGLEFGFIHTCNHSILSSFTNTKTIGSMNTEIYARYESKINP